MAKRYGQYTLSNFAANLGRNVADQLAGLRPELDAGQAQPIKLEKVTATRWVERA